MALRISSEPQAPLSAVCLHCGTPAGPSAPARASAEDPLFCCTGCQTVYHILKEQGLGRYYELKELCVPLRPARPVEEAGDGKDDFSYLDDPEFQEYYLRKTGEARDIQLYLEGVHCVACLWLVEKLHTFVPGVKSAELDLGRSIATVRLTDDVSVARIARDLNRIGYRPHAIRRDEEAEAFQRKENRSWLIRIGVAGACTGNIMMVAIPLYGGAQGPMAELFRWASFVLFLPVLLYSGSSFYQSAWAAVRGRKMSIDVPIVLAIIAGAVASVLNLISGSEHIYFDSLAALIFLLLSSRFVLKRIQQNTLSSSHLLNFLAPSRSFRLNEASGQFEKVATRLLKADDLLMIATGETFPADGAVERVEDPGARGYIGAALLTGEPLPQPVTVGDPVFSGTKNEGPALVVRIRAVGRATRLGSILKAVEESSLRRAPIVAAADRISRWFLAAVLLASAAVFLAAGDRAEGFERALALLIVTCPCALALAVPLSMSVSLSGAGRSGMLIKGAEVLEKLAQLKAVILDKTGTLTKGRFEVLEWSETPLGLADPALKAAVIALELRSRHPIARALCKYLGNDRTATDLPSVDEFHEELGQGVSGIIGGHRYEIRAMTKAAAQDGKSPAPTTQIGVFRDSELSACVVLGDELRPDSADAVRELRNLGLGVRIVSGDNPTAVRHVAEKVGITAMNTLAQASPERKRVEAEAERYTLMVGDGANDAVALATSFVSAAVHGSVEVSLRTADVYLSAPGVHSIVRLITAGRETMRVIRRNLAFSIAYNLAGGLAAAFGLVTPVFAAVLMPLSALTVFVSSLWGTRKLRQTYENVLRMEAEP